MCYVKKIIEANSIYIYINHITASDVFTFTFEILQIPHLSRKPEWSQHVNFTAIYKKCICTRFLSKYLFLK